MATLFKIKKGTEAHLPTTITDGVMYFCTDTGNIFVDDGTERIQINADKAAKDTLNQEIDATYIKGLSVNGKVITYTRGDGTTGTITTQDTNTDTKVTQTVTTSNASYPILLAPAGQTATATTTSYFDSEITVNPSTNTIAANISGKAATATTADKTANSLSFSTNGTAVHSFNGSAAKTINLTGSGAVTITSDTNGNINIKGTNTTYSDATTSASGLMSKADKEKLDGITASADAVSFSPSLTAGTKIGTITINGTATDIYGEKNTDTDTKVIQNLDNSSTGAIPILLANSTTPTSGVATVAKYSTVTVTPKTGTITATTFSGNATSATKATQDGNGNNIVNTYSTKANTVRDLEISGKTITVTKDDGTTDTLTTQDTTYTFTASNPTLAWGETSTIGTAGGATYKVTMPANPNSHYTTKLFATSSTGTAHAATTNGHTYLRLFDDSTARQSINIKGSGATTVTSDANGVITISSTDENTTYSSATQSSPGLMSAADKKKLDGIATGAQVNTVTSVVGKTGAVTLDKGDVGLGNVTNESKATMFTSAALTGTPTAPTATAGTNTTQIATTAFVNTEINNKIAAADAMIYKGTIGTNGTVTALPASHKTGYTYKVITAGTYAGVKCEVGDMIICLTDGTSANDAHWTVVQTNLDGAVSGPASAVANRVAVFDGTTGKVIKDSGYTIAKSVPSDAKFTDTTYTFTANAPTLSWDQTSTIGTAGGATYTVKMPSNPNTHYTTKLFATSSTGTAHAATSNGGTYLRLFDDSTARQSIKITGSGATTVTSDANGVITISSTDNNTTYSSATQSAPGLMSAADKKKLDGIAEGANKYTYTLPNATSSVLGGVKIGSNITVSSGTISLTKDNVVAALGYTPPTADTNTTYGAGNGLTLSSTTFHVGAGAGITVSADEVSLATSGVTAGSYGPSANATPAYGATFNVPYITVDAYGRVTSASTKTVTIPASDNVDTKVTQTVVTTNGAFPLLLRGTSAGTTTTTTGTSFAAAITANPSTGTVAAAIFDATTEVDIGDCKLVYDSTNKCLNFTF